MERLKLSLLGRPEVRFLDTVLPPADASARDVGLGALWRAPGEYVLVVPGGGTGHPGALAAPQIIAEAARRIALRSYPTLLVGVAANGAQEVRRRRGYCSRRACRSQWWLNSCVARGW